MQDVLHLMATAIELSFSTRTKVSCSSLSTTIKKNVEQKQNANFIGYIILCNPVVTATGLLPGVRISFDDHSAH